MAKVYRSNQIGYANSLGDVTASAVQDAIMKEMKGWDMSNYLPQLSTNFIRSLMADCGELVRKRVLEEIKLQGLMDNE